MSSTFSPTPFEKLASKFEEKLHALVKMDEKEIVAAVPKLIREAMAIYKQYPKQSGRLLHYFIGYARVTKVPEFKKAFLVNMATLDRKGELWRLGNELEKAEGSGAPTASKTDPKPTTKSSSAKPKPKRKEKEAVKSGKRIIKSAEIVNSEADLSESDDSGAPISHPPPPKPVSAKAKGRAKERKAATLEDEEEEEAPKSRKKRRVATEERDEDEVDEVVEKPKAKRTKGKGKAKAAPPVFEDIDSEVPEPQKKGRSAKPHIVNDEGEEETKKAAPKSKGPKSVADGEGQMDDDDDIDIAALTAAFMNNPEPHEEKPPKKRKHSGDTEREGTPKDRGKKPKISGTAMSEPIPPKIERTESPPLQIKTEEQEPTLAPKPKSQKRKREDNAEAGPSKSKPEKSSIVSDAVKNIKQKLAERGMSDGGQFKGAGNREDWYQADFVCLPCYRSQKICLRQKMPKRDRLACLNCHVKKKKCPYSSGAPLTHGMGSEGEVILGERDDMSSGEAEAPLSYAQALADILLGVRDTNSRMAALEMEVTRLRAELDTQTQISSGPPKVFQDVGIEAAVTLRDVGVAALLSTTDDIVKAEPTFVAIGVQADPSPLETEEDSERDVEDEGPLPNDHKESPREASAIPPTTPQEVPSPRSPEPSAIPPTTTSQVESPRTSEQVERPPTSEHVQEATGHDDELSTLSNVSENERDAHILRRSGRPHKHVDYKV